LGGDTIGTETERELFFEKIEHIVIKNYEGRMEKKEEESFI
jgi:hypothetical protein